MQVKRATYEKAHFHRVDGVLVPLYQERQEDDCSGAIVWGLIAILVGSMLFAVYYDRIMLALKGVGA